MKRMLSALAAFAIMLAALPAAASDSDLLTIGRALGIVPQGCSYGGGVQRGTCLARQAKRTIERQDRNRVREAQAERRNLENMAAAAQQLDRACKVGDRWSCQRANQLRAASGGNRLPILRALSAACRSGDQASCQRLRR